MDIRKFNPSNWFRHEDEDKSPALRRGDVSPRQAFHSEIDKMFDKFVNSFWNDRQPFFEKKEKLLKPDLDLRSTDTEYVLTVELPGVDENDVRIEIAGDTMEISGEKKYENEDKDDTQGVHRIERRYGFFRRTLVLPDDAKTDDISAAFSKGILTVAIPRTEPENRKQIPIQKETIER